MPRARVRGPKTSLDVRSIPLTITKSDALKAYIQVFTHDPENITQKSLGSVFGVFKIASSDSDTAFIVNFLTSEFKKEYYANTARPADTSFESALNRINLALSELAKQGNIGWMGKLEAAICSLDKTHTLHFSATGNASVLLFRDGHLTIISEGLAPEETDNPLKTFSEISSGKLIDKDKVIVTTQELFDVFPERELTRHARRFSPKEFTQCVHTALVNSVPIAGSVVLDVLRKQIVSHAETKKVTHNNESDVADKNAIPNVFSQQTFREANRTPASKQKKSQSQENTDRTNAQEEENRIENHIYIQQKIPSAKASTSSLQENFLVWKEHAANALDTSRESISKSFQKYRRSLIKTAYTRYAALRFRMQNARPKRVRVKVKQKSTPQSQVTRVAPTPKDPPPLRIPMFEKEKKEASANVAHQTQRPLPLLASLIGKIKSGCASLLSHTKIDFPAKFSFIGRIPFTWRLVVGILLVAAVLALGSFALFKTSSDKAEIVQNESQQETVTENMSENTREGSLAKESTLKLLSMKDVRVTNIIPEVLPAKSAHILSNDRIAVLGQSEITLIQDDQAQNTFSLASAIPDTDNETFVESAFMSDLQTIFLLTDRGNVFAFIPTTGTFSQTNISVDPEKADRTLIAAYSTYLYVADTETGSILRYPRVESEGGFGDPVTWLTEGVTSLSGATDMAIDGSIYLAAENRIIRLENRAENPFSVEQPTIDASFTFITTSEDSNTLFVYDSNEERVLLYNKQDGSFTGAQQYALPEELIHAEYLSLSQIKDEILLTSDSQAVQFQL